MFYLAALIVYTLYLTTQIVHLIIFILAVERFFIHFYPSINISSLPKYTTSLIKYVYVLLMVRDIATLVGAISSNIEYHKLIILYGVRLFCCFALEVISYNFRFQSVFLFFNVLILSSALLYIPIVIKIRKLKTNRQGFWQTITVFGFKLVCYMANLLQYICKNFRLTFRYC